MFVIDVAEEADSEEERGRIRVTTRTLHWEDAAEELLVKSWEGGGGGGGGRTRGRILVFCF